MKSRNKILSRCRDGSALIMALWVIVLLSMMIGFFAFDMHVETRITSYYRKRLKASYLARAGIERARMLLVKSSDQDIAKDTFEEKDAKWFGDAKHLALGGAVNGFVDDLGSGKVTVKIVPEPARRNINRLSREDWERVFELALIPEELWEELIDAFYDWTDTDNASRSYGAETDDYYANLKPPYRAKNGPLFTVDEILLIKGFTRPMLYGGTADQEDKDFEPMIGMKDLLTIYGDGKVNVNAASIRVLMTLPNVDEVAADEIIQERDGYGDDDPEEDHSFKDPSDFFSRFPTLSSSLSRSIITDSKTYRITAIGDSQGVTHEISCIADVTDSGEMTILRWIEN